MIRESTLLLGLAIVAVVVVVAARLQPSPGMPDWKALVADALASAERRRGTESDTLFVWCVSDGSLSASVLQTATPTEVGGRPLRVVDSAEIRVRSESGPFEYYLVNCKLGWKEAWTYVERRTADPGSTDDRGLSFEGDVLPSPSHRWDGSSWIRNLPN